MPRLPLLAVCVVALSASVCWAQPDRSLHRVDAETPQGLRELFRFDGSAMPLLSAHRGGAVPGYPENCLETFEHTLRHSFSMLEIDLRYTKDGHLVLHHDRTLDRTTTGTGPIGDKTLQELKQLKLKDSEGKVTEFRMPTLDEALRWAKGKTIVILDRKEVPVEVCVQKIQQHGAQAYAMVMASSANNVTTCYRMDPDIMMEVMLGKPERMRQFQATGVPFDCVIAFVGHDPPADKPLLDQLHAQGVCCMAGTSRNLDKRLPVSGESQRAELQRAYQDRLDFGIDLIETDRPIDVAALLYSPADIPASKSRFFHHPTTD